MRLHLVTAALLFSSSFVYASHHGDLKALRSCMQKWGKTPFSKEDPDYRILKMKVKVLGIGGNIVDEVSTKKPELVLVKANVSVLSNTKIRLLNPNGWYCLKGKVSVLGKTTVQIACNAKIASPGGDGTNVLGANDTDGGATVLGTARIQRMGCADRDETAAKEAEDKENSSHVEKIKHSNVKSKDVKSEDNSDDDDKDDD